MKDLTLDTFKYKIISHSQSPCTAEDSQIKKGCQGKAQNEKSELWLIIP